MSAAVDPETELRFCTKCRAVYRADFARCPNDGGVVEIFNTDPLIATAVAHYTIDAYIGSGAMGRVYRGHHTRLHHKLVALKVLRGDLAATMSMRLRFTQEAEAASRLVHPNVVSVTDFGRTDEGLLYIAMDFVEGETLTKVIAKRPISPRRTVKIVRQMCLGLAHAHDLGFVHRDFKPDNIIIVRDGDAEVPRIVDFGLAIHADPDAESARLTTAGAAVGTPVYAAPEQLSNDEVDHRADLFGLGVTMFEMLSGRIPFDGNMLETMHLNATADRPTIAARAPGIVVPLRLEQLVHRLMAPAREDRPASTLDVIEELDVIEHEMTAALITPAAGIAIAADTTRRTPVSPRRGRGLVTLVGVAGLVAAGVLVFALVQHEPSTDPVAPPPVVKIEPTVAKIAPSVVNVKRPVVTEPAPIAVEHEAVAAHDIGSDARISHTVRTVPRTTGRHVQPVPVRKPDIDTVGVVPDTNHVDEVASVPPRDGPGSDKSGKTNADLAGRGSDTPPTRPDTKLVPDKPAAKVATSARLAVDDLSVRGSLTPAQVKRALDRVKPALRACYGPAATKAAKSPSIAVRVRFEIDESQHARSIQTTATELPGLSGCIDKALASVRVEAAPDVGTVDVTLVLQFVPEGS